MVERLVVAITGASGSVYAKSLLEKLVVLKDQWTSVGVIFSTNAYYNWSIEIGSEFDEKTYPFDFYKKNDFNAPFASGSAKYECMIVIPCSMGTLGRITHGISDDLVTRAADVILKERRKLILCPRETPLSTLHLENMAKLSGYGAIVCPAIPSFYSKPKSIEEVVATVTDRILDLAGFELSNTFRWGE